MTTTALLPERKLPASPRAASPPAAPPVTPRYWAFLSYSHRDEGWADWLHKALESYNIPSSVAGRTTSAGTVPGRLAPIFRDRHELAASGDLGGDIRHALASSRALVVLCSPAAAASRWVDEEIATFKRLHFDGCVLAAIVAGQPFASETPGREAEECFPPALRHRFDRRGRPTAKRAEPIAADFRDTGDGKRLGKLKLIAGILDVRLDELARREAQRRHKRLIYLAAGSLAGMVVTSGLAVVALQARNDAQEQRAEAEGMVGFMLGDLRAKLQPLGRLDVLDSVGGRALGYYQSQDKRGLTDDGLAQRSKALTLIGEIAQLRGDLDGALIRYREALAGTAEAMKRAPDDQQRIFDHGQNVFWVGYIAVQRGRRDDAHAHFREYKRLAQRLVALDPRKQDWRVEALSADTNLGMLLHEEGHFGRAASAFESALREAEKLAAADPGNRRYQDSVSESLAYLADAQRSGGRLEDAMGSRERQLGVLTLMTSTHGSSADLNRRIMVARLALGHLYAERGVVESGLGQFRLAAALGEELRRIEPDNTEWMNVNAAIQADFAELLLAVDRTGEAEPLIRAACDGARRLVQRDPSVIEWRFGRIGRCLYLRAEAAAARGHVNEALAIARQAVALAAQDRRASRIMPSWAIAVQRLTGEQQAALGQSSARSTWEAALGGLGASPNTPQHQVERYLLLRRLGRARDAAAAAARLDAIGYRHPRYISARRG